MRLNVQGKYVRRLVVERAPAESCCVALQAVVGGELPRCAVPGRLHQRSAEGVLPDGANVFISLATQQIWLKGL